MTNAGKISAIVAKQFAENEFEKYRVIQDSLYKSDFDRLVEESENLTGDKNVK